MDPLTVLSVAGNLVQFVEFALKIVSKGNRIYHSGDGSLAENSDLELVTNDLLVLQTKLQLSSTQISGTTISNSDEDLSKLLSASNEVAESLLKRLNSVKANGKFRRWNSLRQAVKSVCSKPEVDNLAKRLTDFRDELQTRVLVSFSLKYAENNVEIKHTLEDIQRKCSAISGRVEKLSDQILSYERNTKNDNTNRTDRAKLCAEVGPSHTCPVGAQLSEDEMHQAVLKAFKYPSMNTRHETISEAHSNTFRWILQESGEFDVPWDNFMSWLRNGGDLYWLKGKAASGKSTLVKFAVQQKEVRDALKTWSGSYNLIQASFFFWALGTPMQKSRFGLLMSLIHQILTHDESLTELGVPVLRQEISCMKPDDVKCLQSSWKLWTLSELSCTLDNILKQAASRSKICLFIDGVDEVAGDHTELAALLSQFAVHENVKLCVSGRPIPSLEYEFGSKPSLQLQDLTRNDIHAYVRDKLNSHRYFASIYRQDCNGAEKLIERIVRTSSGVFLWVHLVTNSLIEGLTNFDTIDDLKQRLSELPAELDALYRSMLQSIRPSFYKSQASMLLQIVYQYRFPMSSLTISFASEPDTDMAINADISTIDYDEAILRIDAITNRLKSRCRGLVEVSNISYSHYIDKMVDYPPRPDKVQFLHLTVREFLEQPEIWREINSWTDGTDFDVNVACLQGIVTLTKKTLAFHAWRKPLMTLLGSAMSYAREAENSLAHNCRNLVDEIDKVGQYVFPKGRWTHWTSDLVADHDRVCSHRCWCPDTSFLWYCIRKGLLQYVNSVPDNLVQKLNATLKGFLLMHATGADRESGLHYHKDSTDEPCELNDDPSGPEAWDHFSGYHRPYPPMIKLLFDKGLDPNESTTNTTPWTALVSYMAKYKATRPSMATKWIDTTRIFILYGANLLHCPNPAIRKGMSEPIADTLYAVFGHLPQHLTNDLFIMIRERTKALPSSMEGPQALSKKNRPLAERIARPQPNQQRGRKRGACSIWTGERSRATKPQDSSNEDVLSG